MILHTRDETSSDLFYWWYKNLGFFQHVFSQYLNWSLIVTTKKKYFREIKKPYAHEPFKKRKVKNGITRVYKKGSSYAIAPKKLNVEGIGVVDMSKKGISYQEFLKGGVPNYVEALECPMGEAGQGECADIDGFQNKCNELNKDYLSYIPNCKYKANKAECWKRYYEGGGR